MFSSQETVLFSWEAWETLHLLECLSPWLLDPFWLLDWPVWGRNASFPSGRESCRGNVAFSGQNCLGGPPAKGELLPSWEERCAIAWELLSSWEGSWAMAWEEGTEPVCRRRGLGPSPSWEGGRGLAGGVTAFPRGKGVPACLLGLLTLTFSKSVCWNDRC